MWDDLRLRSIALSGAAALAACGGAQPQRVATVHPATLSVPPNPKPPAAEQHDPRPVEPPPASPRAASELAGSTPGPLVFEQAAADGSWLVVCRATLDSDGDGHVHAEPTAFGGYSGDKLERQLLFASGDAVAIDDWLAASADGRWLVVTRAGRGELWNVSDHSVLDLSALGADLRKDPGLREAHRALVFDHERLLYVRDHGRSGSDLIERELDNGNERVVTSVPTPIVRVSADAGGRALWLQVPGRDANGNGRFDWPRKLEQERSPCKSPLPRFIGPNPYADPLDSVVVDRASGVARKLDNLAAILGGALVLREADGALVLSERDRRRPLADKNCAGRVLWSDPAHDNLLIGCTIPKRTGRLAVELVHRATRTPLDIDVAALSLDEPTHPATRLVPLYPGADTVLFDSDKRMLHRLTAGDQVLASAGAHALIRRNASALWFDADSETLTELPGTLSKHGELLRAGSLCFVSPLLIDVASGQVLGSVQGRPLALTAFGALLFPEQTPSATRLAEGPLAWRSLPDSSALAVIGSSAPAAVIGSSAPAPLE